MAQSSEPRVAICTNSLGKSASGHGILRKLEAARAHGFDGVEVAWECLEAYANEAKSAEGLSRSARLRAAAREVVKKADSLTLEIIAVNPFKDYDSLADAEDVKAGLKEAELWCQICNIFGARILQIPPCMYPTRKILTSDYRKIADNLRQLGQLAEKHGLIIAYEGVAWGIHVNTWEQVHEILSLTNHPNVRHCLDTFHIAAKVAGDPCNASAPIRPEGLRNLEISLEEMKRTIKPSDIGYLQLSDATVADPQQKDYPVCDLNQPPFMTQSRNCRMFPCEPAQYGGTLPALDVAKAIFDIGYRGWVSMEVFHKDLWAPDPA